MKRSAEDRFWANVQIAEGDACWLWRAGKNGVGYGRMRFNGRGDRAHRVSYQLTFGVIPEGLFVLHKCDTPACVRPDHLFLGTQAQNLGDMVTKGRHGTLRKPESVPRGDRHWASKLTEEAVRAIRADHRAGLGTCREFASKLGVHVATIDRVLRGKSWRHI